MKLLKQFNLFPLIIALAISTSCDDGETPNPFVGIWIYVNETYTQCDNASDEGVFDYECSSLNCNKISFESNKKFSYESLVGGVSTLTEGTYSYEDGQLIICSTGCDDPYDFTISNMTLSLIRKDDAGCTVTTSLEKIN